MFYLKELILIIRDHKALAMANLALLALFTGILQHKAEIRSFFAMDSKNSSYPYFNALVSSKTSSDYIIRKMRNLPGVSNVSVRQAAKLKSELGGFFRELGEGSDLLPKSLSSFKVVLEKDTRPESRKLIREYFARLVGKKDITFSQIKTPKRSPIKSNSLYSTFVKWADVYLSAVAGLGWFFTLWLISQPMAAQSFVIERFQRKEKTSLKMYAWLWAIPVIGCMAAALAMDLKVGLADFAPAVALLGLGAFFFARKSSTPRRFI